VRQPRPDCAQSGDITATQPNPPSYRWIKRTCGPGAQYMELASVRGLLATSAWSVRAESQRSATAAEAS